MQDEDATQALATALMGPLYAGWSAQLFLAGLFFSSFAHYVEGSQWRDHSQGLKALLGSVAGLLAIQTAFSVTEIFYFGVNQTRTVDAFLSGHWPMAVTPTLTAIIATIVQASLTVRAGQLFLRNWVRWTFYAFQTLVIIIAFMGSCIVTGLGILYLERKEEQALPLTFNIGVGIWLLASAIADTSISIALFSALRARSKSAGGFNPATMRLLSILVRAALQTAAFTAINSIGGAVVSVAFRETDLMTTDVPYAFFLPMSSLYALSLFHNTFNSRRKMSEELMQGRNATEIPTYGGGRSRSRARRPDPKFPLRIQVHMTREINVDVSRDEEEDELERSIRHMKMQAGSIV